MKRAKTELNIIIVIIKFCLVFPKIFLLHKVVRDAKKVEKHWSRLLVLKWRYACPLAYAKVLQGVHNFLKCLHNEILT